MAAEQADTYNRSILNSRRAVQAAVEAVIRVSSERGPQAAQELVEQLIDEFNRFEFSVHY